MAIEHLLLWLAVLGHSLQFTHAEEPSGVVLGV